MRAVRRALFFCVIFGVGGFWASPSGEAVRLRTDEGFSFLPYPSSVTYVTPSPEGEGFFKFSGMTYNGLYSSYHYQHYTYRHSERSAEYVFRRSGTEKLSPCYRIARRLPFAGRRRAFKNVIKIIFVYL